MTADHAAAVLRGEARCRDFLSLLRVNLTTGDELLRVLQSVTDPEEMVGLTRALQKHIEGMARL
jgi:hypothetical protein